MVLLLQLSDASDGTSRLDARPSAQPLVLTLLNWDMLGLLMVHDCASLGALLIPLM